MTPIVWQRAVVKVGSALIAPSGQACSGRYVLELARFISASQRAGKQIILVSSGAVAAGRPHIATRHRPTIAQKQAMAAIGQAQMMANWQRYFDQPCAQMLLSADDLRHRQRYVNIQNTLRELLRHQALPIVNENDTVSVDELKVGDNDNLAAYTALMAQADTMIICSDIDGLYTADPRRDPQASFIPRVARITEATHQLAGGAGTAVGTGGMQTKLQAAELCARSGIQTCIINGHQPAVFDALLAGQVQGTLFDAHGDVAQARALWIAYTLRARGQLEIDPGARQALTSQGASLLVCGITGCHGDFRAGDAVTIVCDGEPLAKGIVNYDSKDLLTIKGLQSGQVTAVLGYARGPAVHRDDLVRLQR